jgi:hypothetical protein
MSVYKPFKHLVHKYCDAWLNKDNHILTPILSTYVTAPKFACNFGSIFYLTSDTVVMFVIVGTVSVPLSVAIYDLDVSSFFSLLFHHTPLHSPPHLSCTELTCNLLYAWPIAVYPLQVSPTDPSTREKNVADLCILFVFASRFLTNGHLFIHVTIVTTV